MKVLALFGLGLVASVASAVPSSQVANEANCIRNPESRSSLLCSSDQGKLIGSVSYKDELAASWVKMEMVVMEETVPILDQWSVTEVCNLQVQVDLGKDSADLSRLGVRFLKPSSELFTEMFTAAGVGADTAKQQAERVLKAITESAVSSDRCKAESGSVKVLRMSEFKARKMMLYAPYNSSAEGYGGRVSTVGFDLAKETEALNPGAKFPPALVGGEFRTRQVGDKPQMYFVHEGHWFRAVDADFGRYRAQAERAHEQLKGTLIDQEQHSYYEMMVDGVTYVVDRNLQTNAIARVIPTFRWHDFSYDFYPKNIDMLKMNEWMSKMPAKVWVEPDAHSLYETLLILLASKDLDFVSAKVVMTEKSRDAAPASIGIPQGLLDEKPEAGPIQFVARHGDFSASIGLGFIELTRKTGEVVKLSWDGCHLAEMDRYQWMGATAPGVRGIHEGFWYQLQDKGFRLGNQE